MLSEKELDIMRRNAKTHKRVFEKIRAIAGVGTCAKYIDDMALKMCQEDGVLSAFT